MDFPGRIIKVGEPDKKVVKAIADALASKGYAVTSPSGVYDEAFKSVVMLFQAQNVDESGRSLHVDGKIGSLTWGSLFGAQPVAVPPAGAAGAALGVAVSQIGVMEQPLGSNAGPMVDKYLKSVNTPSGNFWCMAFVHWCFEQASNGTTIFPRTAGCLDAWNSAKKIAGIKIVTRAQAIANPTLVRPGAVFIHDYGSGHGHTGFVRQSIGGALRTIEGNSNNNGSRNGLGVFELNRRNVADATLKGFLDLT